MPKYPKNHKDVEYYAPGRKRRIAGSTKATSDFLALVCADHPEATISQLRDLLTDRARYIFEPDAVAVLDAYIAKGFGEYVPRFR